MGSTERCLVVILILNSFGIIIFSLLFLVLITFVSLILLTTHSNSYLNVFDMCHT